MSRHENIRRAKEIVSNRRAASISVYEQHNAEISAKIPEFREITAELNMTGLKIMGAALGKGDAELSLDRIHAEYDLLAKRKRQILKENGYPEDYCDIHFSCAKCSDTGYVGIDICDCLRRELIYISLETSGLYNLVKEQNFSTFSMDYYTGEDRAFMMRNFALLRAFCENFVPLIARLGE